MKILRSWPRLAALLLLTLALFPPTAQAQRQMENLGRGVVAVNEPSLWVEVIAPHRGEAFAAGQHLIDEMKRLVPIWKKPLG